MNYQNHFFENKNIGVGSIVSGYDKRKAELEKAEEARKIAQAKQLEIKNAMIAKREEAKRLERLPFELEQQRIEEERKKEELIEAQKTIELELAQEKEKLAKLEEQKENAKRNIEIHEEELELQRLFQGENSLEQLYNTAQKMIGNTKFSPQDFSKFYSQEEIDRDVLKLTKKIEESIAENSNSREKSKKIATILEYIIAVCINHSKWLGENVSIFSTSMFDDWIRGIDGILEMTNPHDKNESSKHLAFGIDITFSSIMDKEFEDKIQSILYGINEGKLVEAKYFQKPTGEILPKLKMPKIIISVKFSEVRTLVFDFKNLDKEEYKQRLENHPMKYHMIEQILGQCNLFANYARSINEDYVARAYENVIDFFDEIAQDDDELKEMIEKYYESNQQEDAVYKKINQIASYYDFKAHKESMKKPIASLV